MCNDRLNISMTTFRFQLFSPIPIAKLSDVDSRVGAVRLAVIFLWQKLIRELLTYM